jgi:hypothetical protein
MAIPFAIVVVVGFSPTTGRAQVPTPEGATRQADAAAQKDAIRVIVVHAGAADACGANGERCTAKDHWGYTLGDAKFAAGTEGETNLGNALKTAAAKAGVTTGTEPGAPKVLIVARKTTPYGLVQNVMNAAAAAKLAKLEVVVEKDAGREGMNTPVNLPSDKGLVEGHHHPDLLEQGARRDRAAVRDDADPAGQVREREDRRAHPGRGEARARRQA